MLRFGIVLTGRPTKGIYELEGRGQVRSLIFFIHKIKEKMFFCDENC